MPALNAGDAQQARANGAIAQLGNLGTGLGTPIYAAAIAAWGTMSVHALTGILSLAGLAGLLAIHGRGPRP